MFATAHFAAGLLIGKITGNYPAALVGSLLIDADHLVPYIRHRIIFDAKKLWKTVTDETDPYGNQRNYLHSFFTLAVVAALSALMENQFWIVVSFGYLGHLTLDLLDNSDFFPFYPFKYNFRGPVKYLSKEEFAITVALFLAFVLA